MALDYTGQSAMLEVELMEVSWWARFTAISAMLRPSESNFHASFLSLAAQVCPGQDCNEWSMMGFPKDPPDTQLVQSTSSLHVMVFL